MNSDDTKQFDNGEEENFAELFERSFKDSGRLEPGQKIEAKILKISAEWVFIDTGRKGEGVLDKKELLDADGNLTVREGDVVSAWFLSSADNEMRFTTRIGGSAGNSQLEDAWRSAIPVQGVVEKEIKGGFEVKLGGTVRAFCPFSQMGLRRVEDNSEYIGKHLSFRITEYGEKGRNIVLSHRAVLEEEQQKKKDELKESLREGMTVVGIVTSLQNFGAFVNIGSIEGLIPVSEIGWSRVKNVADVLAVGQQVEVTVKKIDWGNDRISFSLKDTLADPWEKVAHQFPEGSFHSGKISRLTTFGAFVTLADGVDGLLHISKLGGGKRINHPREVVNEGQDVEVKVESVDRENRRLSLSLAEASRAEAEQASALEDFRQMAQESAAKSMGSLGDLLKAKLEKKK